MDMDNIPPSKFERGQYCSIVSAVFGAAAVEAIGATAALAITGAAVGATVSGVTGGNVLEGAALGAVGGGIGGALGGASGIGDALGGAASSAGDAIGLGSGLESAADSAAVESAIGAQTGGAALTAQGVNPDIAGLISSGPNGAAASQAALSPLGSAATSAAQGSASSTALGAAGSKLGISPITMAALSGLSSLSKPQQYPVSNVTGALGTAANQQEGALFNSGLSANPILNRGAIQAPAGFNPYNNQGAMPTWMGTGMNLPYGTPTASTGLAHGGQPHGALQRHAHGGREFSTKHGDNYVHGDSLGQEDDIPAALSSGEFVFDASSTSRAGDGNNQAGARVLNRLRHIIAEKAGNGVPQRKIGNVAPLYEKARREVLGKRK